MSEEKERVEAMSETKSETKEPEEEVVVVATSSPPLPSPPVMTARNEETLPAKLCIGPTIEFPPIESVCMNGDGKAVGDMQDKLVLALMPALQDLMYAVEKQERRKRKKVRRGKKQPYDIDPLSFLAQHLLKNNVTYNKMDLERAQHVGDVVGAFNLKAGRLRTAQEFSQSVMVKSENRYYHKVQRALAIKQAQMDALAARERRSPKSRRRSLSHSKE